MIVQYFPSVIANNMFLIIGKKLTPENFLGQMQDSCKSEVLISTGKDQHQLLLYIIEPHYSGHFPEVFVVLT